MSRFAFSKHHSHGSVVTELEVSKKEGRHEQLRENEEEHRTNPRFLTCRIAMTLDIP
jgi:hypothetical protein